MKFGIISLVENYLFFYPARVRALENLKFHDSELSVLDNRKPHYLSIMGSYLLVMGYLPFLIEFRQRFVHTCHQVHVLNFGIWIIESFCVDFL